MCRNGLADLVGSKTILFPFKFDSGVPAKRFDLRFISRAKELLPTDIETICVIAHVPQFSFGEKLSELRVEQQVNPATIDDRSFTTLFRRRNAVEPDLHWPAIGMGTFVVKQNGLIGRVRRRAVDVAVHSLAR